MRVRRDISSVPLRSAADTWQQIIALITGTGSKDVAQLEEAAGVMGSIITDEHPSRRAIVVEGVGAQLRLYCRYGLNAVEEGASIDSLTWNPTAGDWTMHVPCDAENLGWVKTSLARTSPRIKVFDVTESERADGDSQDAVAAKSIGLTVDWTIKG